MTQLAFKVAAGTVLERGAELISSDAVAIYELVKNAIDARSPDGVGAPRRHACPSQYTHRTSDA